MTTVSPLPSLQAANASRAPNALFTESTTSLDVYTDIRAPSTLNCPVLTTISRDLRAGTTSRGSQAPLELAGSATATLAHDFGPEGVYELVGKAFRTAWATSTCITFVIS